jgi:hypothetical protein
MYALRAGTRVIDPSPPIAIGECYAVTFSWSEYGLKCEWEPGFPSRQIADRILPNYRLARAAFVAAVSAETGLNILMVEI